LEGQAYISAREEPAMPSYVMYFKNETDIHIRAALSILHDKGYPAVVSLGGDGVTWFYESGGPVEIDPETEKELDRIGVKILER
jgi:hypothetical protein